MSTATNEGSGAVCGPEPVDTTSSLKTRLLRQIHSYPTRTKHPAKILYIEVDGICIGSCQPGQTFPLPHDSRSLTLRDENQTARVHILTEQIEEKTFDNGQITITIKERDGKPFLIVC